MTKIDYFRHILTHLFLAVLYSAHIGVDLAFEIETQFDNNIINFSQNMDTPTSTQPNLKCITETEILKAIANLENKNCSGHDGISKKTAEIN